MTSADATETMTIGGQKSRNRDGEVLLDMEGVHVSYGGVPALKGVSLQVRQGEFVAVLGANGAGKSTVLKTVSGVLKPTSGVVRLAGREIQGRSPWSVARLGVGHVPEGRRILGEQTVEENLQLGGWVLRQDRKRYEQTYERVLGLFPHLRDRLGQGAGTLSGGEAQMLAVARSLMVAPRLLMLDEPSLGLAPQLVAEMFTYLRRLHREEGMTILLVEQAAALALALASRCYVIQNGCVALEGPSKELRDNEEIQRLYLGG